MGLAPNAKVLDNIQGTNCGYMIERGGFRVCELIYANKICFFQIKHKPQRQWTQNDLERFASKNWKKTRGCV